MQPPTHSLRGNVDFFATTSTIAISVLPHTFCFSRYNVGDHQPMQLVNGVMRDSGISGLQDEHRKFPAVPLAACCDS